MHIPDGYLSPGTAAALYAVMVPAWIAAGRKVRAAMSVRVLPVMALMSAFCFVIQMLNVPLPGGTTGHAVGASLAAIVLGPWPAVIAVSTAVVIQALLFGDGGVTAIGANCFNMAFVQVWISYYIYRTLNVAGKPARTSVAAAVSGYVGINAAALLAGLELGLQPVIAHTPSGAPLYAPYPLAVTIPAMLLGHLIAGFAEAAVAAAGVSYVHRTAPELFVNSHVPDSPIPRFWRALRALWIVVGVLVILAPLGLLAPGTAWGEWSSEQMRHHGLGFVPAGLQRLENFWRSAFSDYSIPGTGEKTGYLLSAALGVLLIATIFWVLTAMGKRRSARHGES